MKPKFNDRVWLYPEDGPAGPLPATVTTCKTDHLGTYVDLVADFPDGSKWPFKGVPFLQKGVELLDGDCATWPA